jgi:selenocysteine-specific elongation factor
MPSAALRRELGLVDDAQVLNGVAAQAGLQVLEGRVSRPGTHADLERGAAGLRALVHRLEGAPFAAPERAELDGLRLGRRELGAAERAGVIVRVSPDIVLLPAALDDAVRRLHELPQPFTTSEARQALGTTRRVVIPLLEHLDAQGRTRRIDANRRTVRMT